MAREPMPTWFIVLVVVRLGQRFLLVHERKHGQSWYLPAGRVETGESLVRAARRETLEESGIPVEIESIIRFEHSAYPQGVVRMRVIFVARPLDDTPPKSQPDEESLEAAWVTLEEMAQLPLRDVEVRRICEYVTKGGATYPLELLTEEGAPFRSPQHE